MSFFMTKLFRRKIVPVIKIDGPITELVVDSVNQHLMKIPSKQAHALALVINSSGGSPVQCNILRQKLLIYAKKYNFPLYTFTERHALSGGYYVLTAGNKVIVHESAVVGNLGVQRDFKIFKKEKDPFNLDNFDYDDYTLEYRYDIFEGLQKPNEIKWGNWVMDSLNKKIMDDVQISRDLQRNNWLMNKMILGNKSVALGMADGVGTYQSFISKNHPDCKIVCHMTKSKFEAFVEKVHKYAVLMKSRAFFIVLGLFGLKVFIKWTLILMVWKKSRDSKKKKKKEQKEQQQQLVQQQLESEQSK